MKNYKIRNKKTGLFKCAGWFSRWSKTGKTWQSMAALKGHLRRTGPKPDNGHWGTYYLSDPDWEILEYGSEDPKVIQL